ncbi:MAG: hypothetical protein ACYDC2_05895 [Solirubrobacteraceae bacterium]
MNSVNISSAARQHQLGRTFRRERDLRSAVIFKTVTRRNSAAKKQ